MSDTEAVFIGATLWLLTIIIPAATGLLIWRIFVTNKAQPILGLGLEADPQQTLTSPRSSHHSYLYATMAIATFGIGVLSSRAFEFLTEIVATLVQ